jgi:hypothetical protein
MSLLLPLLGRQQFEKKLLPGPFNANGFCADYRAPVGNCNGA